MCGNGNCQCNARTNEALQLFEAYAMFVSGKMKEHTGLMPQQARLADWGLGLAGETGEIVELLKHNIFHDEPVDKMKLAKEIGDVMFYVQAICESTDIPLVEVMKLNMAKLQHRHGNKFSVATSADRHAREEVFTDTLEYKVIEEKISKYHGGGVLHDGR